MAAIGASLVSGFELVASETELADAIEGADLVISGEGFVDAQSFEGKVVGGVVDLASSLDVPVLVIAGEVFDGCEEIVDAVSLVARFGRERAMQDTLRCIEEVAAERLKA